MLHIGQRLIMLFLSSKLLYLNTNCVISESGSEENGKAISKDCKIDLDEEGNNSSLHKKVEL